MNASVPLILLLLASIALAAPQPPPPGWTTATPRAEIAPRFDYDARGGPDARGSLVIESDQRTGLHGQWRKTFAVTGGAYYRFSVWRKLEGEGAARRVGVARVLWQDAEGKSVRQDKPAFKGYAPGERPLFTSYQPGAVPVATAEYPLDGETDASGWTELMGTYRVPSKATQAVVELEFRWAPQARLEWAGVRLEEVPSPAPRMARLATVHFVPRQAQTPDERRKAFVSLIEQAAQQRADLVVLPEMLTYGSSTTMADVAEPIPGPSTEFFGALAKKHNLYIVPGLIERAGILIYNVAVLIGPDGEMAGKYRKVVLPRPEIEAGIIPGDDYPVFDTRFGKVGMMVCYDGFYPEVARELANRGAEVIAWPVMGCNPLLAAARAVENHVYLVSSTHTDVKNNWMISAVYGHDGLPLVQAKEWGEVVVAEVDLGNPPVWPGLGNMRAEMPRHRPVDARGR